MPRPLDPSRDLLFGLLALQTGLINQAQLVAAFHAWTQARDRPMSEILAEQGVLSAPCVTLVDGLVIEHLRRHGNDTERSLAAIGVGRSTRECLAQIGNPQLDASLARVGAGSTEHDRDPDRTASYAVGTTTSDGQRFRVLRPHARGGLGAVFVALDSELHREVALKQILDSQADDPVSRQRFLLEAEVTGGLEHPGIVPVYGLGTYEGGRPFYAMRLIRGDNLKAAIDRFHADETLEQEPGRRSLELRKLLRRFTDVCNAIEYAHSRGVLHRDIKPGNIIVGRHGETLVVDWGLAKATGRADPGSSERTLRPSSASGSAETLPGSALGTPAYMSPEQAQGDLEHLGPRSDVYSLGATLYCLLTGEPPFAGDPMDIIPRVQRGDFPPPRAVDPAVDPALEAVCLKAMALNPGDRHGSCRALAEDVDRWMADEPVSAWREPLARRAGRWARRHRTAVTAAAVALVAGVIGLAGVLAVQTKAKADLAESLARETRAKTALADANAKLTSANAAVEDRYKLAVEAIETFHTGVSEDFLLKQDQFKGLRDRLLKSASEFYGRLRAMLGREGDATSRRALLQANFEVANLTGIVGRMEDALAIHRDVLAARESMAREPQADLGSTVDVGRSLTAVAAALRQLGKSDEALATYRQAITVLDDPAGSPTAAARALLADCHTGAGLLLSERRDPVKAEAEHRRAVAIIRKLVDESPGVADFVGRLADSHYNLAGMAWQLNKLLEAEAEYHRAAALYRKLADEHPTVTEYSKRLADCHNQLGVLMAGTGTQADSDVEMREAQRIRRRLADDYPGVTEFRKRLADNHLDRGFLMLTRQRPAEAEAEYRQAIALYRKLVDDHPTITEFRGSLAGSHENLASTLTQTGKPAEAEAESRRAMTLYRKLADDDPAVYGALVRFRDIDLHIQRAESLSREGKRAEAEAAFRVALGSYRKLADDHPGVSEIRVRLALTHFQLGAQLSRWGKLTEAEVEYREMLALLRRLVDEHPGVTDFRKQLAFRHNSLAQLLLQAGKLPEAEAESRQALAVVRKLVDEQPGDVFFDVNLAEHHRVLGNVLWQAGKQAGAEAEYRQALGVDQELVDKHPGVPELRVRLAGSHDALGGLISQMGRPGDAEAEYRRGLAVLRKIVENDPTNPRYRYFLAGARNRLGEWLWGANKPAEAEAEFGEALAIQQRLADENPMDPQIPTELAKTSTRIGRLHQAAGHWAQAGNAFRQAVESSERLPSPTADNLYDLACYHALLSGALDGQGSAPAAAEARTAADRAMRRLREAVAAGFRDLVHIRTDPDFNPLRSRPDFQLLMMDLAMPAELFSKDTDTDR